MSTQLHIIFWPSCQADKSQVYILYRYTRSGELPCHCVLVMAAAQHTGHKQLITHLSLSLFLHIHAGHGKQEHLAPTCKGSCELHSRQLVHNYVCY